MAFTIGNAIALPLIGKKRDRLTKTCHSMLCHIKNVIKEMTYVTQGK
jgi:hypothetical protein